MQQNWKQIQLQTFILVFVLIVVNGYNYTILINVEKINFISRENLIITNGYK